MLCSLLQRLLTSPKDSFRDAGTSPSRTCRTASISSLAAYPPRSLANRLKRSVHTNTRRRKLSFITGTQASSTQQQWADKSLNVNNVLMDLNACDMWDTTTRMSQRKRRRTKSMKQKETKHFNHCGLKTVAPSACSLSYKEINQMSHTVLRVSGPCVLGQLRWVSFSEAVYVEIPSKNDVLQ